MLVYVKQKNVKIFGRDFRLLSFSENSWGWKGGKSGQANFIMTSRIRRESKIKGSMKTIWRTKLTA
jgi:hypothetical protein